MKIFQALRKEFWPYQKTKAHSHRVQNKGRNRGNEGPPQTMKVEHEWGGKGAGTARQNDHPHSGRKTSEVFRIYPFRILGDIYGQTGII